MHSPFYAQLPEIFIAVLQTDVHKGSKMRDKVKYLVSLNTVLGVELFNERFLRHLKDIMN